MPGPGEAAFDAYLPADLVLSQADIGVIVADRLGNLLYMNDYAARLFRISGDLSRLAGGPVMSVGLFAGDDLRLADDLARQVLRGRSWEGTFSGTRGDASRVLIRASAVPLRHPAGDQTLYATPPAAAIVARKTQITCAVEMRIRPLGSGRSGAICASRRRSMMSFKLIPKAYRQPDTTIIAATDRPSSGAGACPPPGCCPDHNNIAHRLSAMAVYTRAIRVN